ISLAICIQNSLCFSKRIIAYAGQPSFATESPGTPDRSVAVYSQTSCVIHSAANDESFRRSIAKGVPESHAGGKGDLLDWGGRNDRPSHKPSGDKSARCRIR